MNIFVKALIILLFNFSIYASENGEINLLGRWAVGPSHSLAVDSNYAYVGNGSLISIFDISSVNSIEKVNEFLTSGPVKQVELFESKLFVLDENDKISIYEVADINNVNKLSEFQSDIWSFEFFVENNKIYLTRDDGLLILLLSEQYSISLEGNYESDKELMGVFVRDDIAYIGVRQKSMILLDVRNPQSITKVDSFTFKADLYPTHFCVQDNYLFATCSKNSFSSLTYGFFSILDISDLLNPIEVKSLNLPGDWSSYLPNLHVNDNFAYITNITDVGSYLEILDISEKNNPHVIKSFLTENPSDVTFANKHCFVSDGYSGFKVFDPEASSSEELVFHYKTNDATVNLFVNDNYVFVPSNRAGLNIIDINQYKPISVGIFDNPSVSWLSASDVSVKENYAYIVNYSGGMYVVDISDPTSIQEVAYSRGVISGQMDLLARAIDIKGNYAYVAERDIGFTVFDISNPNNPYRVDSLNLAFGSNDVLASNSLLFLAFGAEGTKIFDITDPTKPVEITTIASISYSLSVSFQNNLLYIAEKYYGLRIFDLSDISKPKEIGNYEADNISFMDVKVNNGNAYIADSRFGLRILNIENPNSIYEVDNYKTDGFASDIFIDKNKIFLADYNNGFYIFEHKATGLENISPYPKKFKLSQNYPNPFNPETTIEFSVPSVESRHASTINLNVYNILGQKIKTLYNDIAKSGTYKVKFDGSDLPSGTYFVRMECGDFSKTIKALLIK